MYPTRIQCVFRSKAYRISSHVDQPLSIRLLKEEYLPKDMRLTMGPLVWKSFNGQNTFEYYLITSDHFDIRLTPIDEFVGRGTPSVTAVEGEVKMESSSIAPELIIRKALPAIVQVQTGHGSGSGLPAKGSLRPMLMLSKDRVRQRLSRQPAKLYPVQTSISTKTEIWP